jgi:hypothetical protein
MAVPIVKRITTTKSSVMYRACLYTGSQAAYFARFLSSRGLKDVASREKFCEKFTENSPHDPQHGAAAHPLPGAAAAAGYAGHES